MGYTSTVTLEVIFLLGYSTQLYIPILSGFIILNPSALCNRGLQIHLNAIKMIKCASKFGFALPLGS